MKKIGIVLFLIFQMGFFSAFAAEEAESTDVCEWVRIEGVKVICFAESMGSFTASDRALAVQKRILHLIEDSSINLGRLSAVPHEDTVDLFYQDMILASVTVADAKANKVDSPQTLVEQTIQKIQIEGSKERKALTTSSLISGVVYSLLATIILAMILFFFSHIYPRIYARIQRAKGQGIKSLRIQSFDILTAERMVEILVWIAQVSRMILTLIVLYIYIPLVLSQFPMTANWAPQILGYILDPLQHLGLVVINYVPKLFFLIVIVVATRFLLRLVRFFFLEVERGHIRFHGFYKEWAQPTYKLVRFFIFTFALVMAFPYIPGSSSPAFRGITVFLGILVSFGSSSAIGNIVAGVVLTYMRPYKIGDRVKIADTVGDITEKNLLITRIRTIKNVDVTVPNTMVLGSHIVNYSATAESQGLILNTTVTLGYDVDWRVAHRLLIQSAEGTDKILKTPKAFVLQTALDNFTVSYEVNAYTDHPNEMQSIYSNLHQNIQDQFNSAGVELLSPNYMAIRNGNHLPGPPQSPAL